MTVLYLYYRDTLLSREELLSEIIGLVRANQVLTDLLDEAAADYLGINRTDARALDVIDQHEGQITAGELAQELRMSTGAVTAVVDRLERAGLARRISDRRDRRRVLLETTSTLRKFAKRVYGSPEDVLPQYEDWTDEELDIVLRFQRFGRDWLQERLANMEKLRKRKTN